MSQRLQIGRMVCPMDFSPHSTRALGLVMGTHGRTGLRRLLGSVAERVVRTADVPVLTAPVPGQA